MIMTGARADVIAEVNTWRDEARETLRTAGFSNDSVDFLRDRNHKYFSFYDESNLIAFGGLTNLIWENRTAEISLIVNPDNRKDGIGSDCVDMLLDEAFKKMNLKTVTGECYKCNTGIDFWFRILEKYNGYRTVLPSRKFWNGEYHDSLWFSIDVSEYKA